MGMAGAMAVLSASSLAEGFTQSAALNAKADFDQAQGDINSRLSLMRADDAIRRGDEEIQNYRKKVAQVRGSQRAALAAQGIALDDGSALALQQDTEEIAARDVATMKANAWRESMGFKSESDNIKYQSRFSAMAARNQANASLVTGGLKAISYGMQAGYYYDNPSGDPKGKSMGGHNFGANK